jgi:hypothetical protein
MNRRTAIFSFVAFSLFLTTQACAGTEVPLTPEVSPPGDIPDSQVFITYKSPAGFSIKVPEGWARKDNGATTTFANKYDLVAVIASDLATPLDLAYAKQNLAPEIEKGRAVKIDKITDVALKGGKAVKISYTENSEPNSVTNKQIRMESERYFFSKNGKLVAVYLSAPLGADNVDQWQLMSSSFRWK